jgi:hypothetical protein
MGRCQCEQPCADCDCARSMSWTGEKHCKCERQPAELERKAQARGFKTVQEMVDCLNRMECEG